MSDRNGVFEGGPYFYNHVDLFVKPWHVGFNSAKELPSKVPIWVCLPRLPLEFWRIAQQSLDKKVISFARICVEVDLNNPLPDSLEICFGSSKWVQQLDYESLPFRCWICHEYGHLKCQCPQVNKGNGGSASGHGGSPSSSAPKVDLLLPLPQCKQMALIKMDFCLLSLKLRVEGKRGPIGISKPMKALINLRHWILWP